MPTGKPLVSADVKKQILERVKKGDVPISQIASEHGVSSQAIYNWLSKGATSAPSWVEVNRLKRENKELKELIGEVTYKMSASQKKN